MKAALWILPILAWAGDGDIERDPDHVGFDISDFSGPAMSVSVNGKDTGCQVSSLGVKLTCHTKAFRNNSIPSNAFRILVDCQNMDATKFDLLTVQAGSACSKLTYTQHLQVMGGSSSSLQMKPGQSANLTCVLFPLDGMESAVSEGWSTADPVDAKACKQAVSKFFEWKLKLLESSQNVHHLLWTSQPAKPDGEPAPYKVDSPFQITGSLKDLSFSDLKPTIMQATVKGGVQVKEHVKLELEQLPKDYTEPTKHEENVKLIVDATQVPKGTTSVNVFMSYEIPGHFERYASVNLPVKDPNIPDVTTETPQITTQKPQVTTEKPQVTTEKPQVTTEVPPEPEKKSSGLGAGIWIILVILLLGLGVGAFLYRRHLRMQAHAREVPP
eukprot:Skav200201  [mRNA]  locus=scaffold623:373194:374472:- [translate_table: standard]